MNTLEQINQAIVLLENLDRIKNNNPDQLKRLDILLENIYGFSIIDVISDDVLNEVVAEPAVVTVKPKFDTANELARIYTKKYGYRMSGETFDKILLEMGFQEQVIESYWKATIEGLDYCKTVGITIDVLENDHRYLFRRVTEWSHNILPMVNDHINNKSK